MGFDTHDVIEAASSKCNFIQLSPSLVGGHCISVAPSFSYPEGSNEWHLAAYDCIIPAVLMTE